jgi:hypothetical protein
MQAMRRGTPPPLTRATIRFAILLPMLLLASGCFRFNTPGDVHVVAIEVGDWRDYSEMPGAQADPLIGTIPTDVLKAAVGTDIQGRKDGPREYLKVRFATSVDLREFARDNGYNVGASAFLCERPRNQRRVPQDSISRPAVYRDGVAIYLGEWNSKERASAPPNEYYFFIRSILTKIESERLRTPEYDFQSMPEAICFYLSGGNNLGGYRSNTVRLPATDIRAAFDRSK